MRGLYIEHAHVLLACVCVHVLHASGGHRDACASSTNLARGNRGKRLRLRLVVLRVCV